MKGDNFLFRGVAHFPSLVDSGELKRSDYFCYFACQPGGAGEI